MKTLHDYITLNPFNTFVIVKPEFTKKAKEIMSLFLEKGYVIAKYCGKRLTYEEAQELYKVHKDEDFYEDLCKYMSSGLSVGYCLNYTGSKDPIEYTNKIKNNIRETFGKDEMKNALHSSDSVENVTREAAIYFK